MKLSEFVTEYELFLNNVKEQIKKETPELKINIVRYLNTIPKNVILEKQTQKFTIPIINLTNKIDFHLRVLNSSTIATYNEKTITIFSDINARWHWYKYRGNYKLFTTKTMYHEQRHYMQEQPNFITLSNPLTKAICDMENIVIKSFIGTMDYSIKHDAWYIEIDAEEYSEKKVRQFMKENPNSYSYSDELELQVDKSFNEYYKLIYSFNNILTIFNRIIALPKYKINYKEMPDWYKLYFKEPGIFKSLQNIINESSKNSTYSDLTEKIITSKYFLNKLNYNTLTDNEIKILTSSINKEKQSIYLKMISLYEYYSGEIVDNNQRINDKTISKNINDYKKDYLYYEKQLLELSDITNKPSKRRI